MRARTAVLRAPLPAPRAFTLVELVVALAVGGVAFGSFALVVAQQERTHAELARRLRARAQMREGLTALVTELRAISPAAGDIPGGGARDSSIEFRATIGSAAVCHVAHQSVSIGLASFVASPQPDDTAWAYVGGSAGSSWMPLAIVALGNDQLPACGLPPTVAGLVDPRRAGRARYSLELSDSVAGISVGTPLRITRHVRYSLYRAPDTRWYLGRREWSPARGLFETIQPVAGPYRAYGSAESGTSGLELRYFDRAGVEIPAGSPSGDRIAHVTLVLRTPPPPGESRVRERRDVTSVTLGVRNRQ